ncbi:uncharacterized protein BDV17DRAFT_288910 [Aspergillus undulatus]|uniref:uncharacterized protein n=1 Tax=Aspergillus undulatus TaxID=1810928 RepID=UPI003CCD7406
MRFVVSPSSPTFFCPLCGASLYPKDLSARDLVQEPRQPHSWTPEVRAVIASDIHLQQIYLSGIGLVSAHGSILVPRKTDTSYVHTETLERFNLSSQFNTGARRVYALHEAC